MIGERWYGRRDANERPRSRGILERSPSNWTPVRLKRTLENKDLEPCLIATRSGTALSLVFSKRSNVHERLSRRGHLSRRPMPWGALHLLDRGSGDHDLWRESLRRRLQSRSGTSSLRTTTCLPPSPRTSCPARESILSKTLAVGDCTQTCRRAVLDGDGLDLTMALGDCRAKGGPFLRRSWTTLTRIQAASGWRSGPGDDVSGPTRGPVQRRPLSDAWGLAGGIRAASVGMTVPALVQWQIAVPCRATQS